MATSPVSSRSEQRVVIQSSALWPTADTDWVTVANYIPSKVSESLGNELGSAEFLQPLGATLPIGAAEYTGHLTEADAVPDQAYVRVGVETSDGEIQVDPDGGPATDELGNPIKDRYTTILIGRVVKRAFSATAATGLVAGITAAGIGIVLDQVSIPTGVVKSATGELAVDGWEFGPFNPCGIGNRSTDPVTIDLPNNIKCHVISPFSMIKWQASDVATTLIALVNLQQDVPFELDPGSLALLNYSDTWDFRGQNAAQILSTLANTRRGLNWRCVYIGDGTPRIRIVFDSFFPGTVPLTIPKSTDDANGSDYILTPTANQQTLNLVPLLRTPQNADHRVVSCTLTQDARACYDSIVLVAGHRERTMSLEIKADGTGEFVKGWDTGLEAAWDAADNLQVKATPKLDHVWRTFRLREDWNGTDRGGSRVTNVLKTDTIEPYGAGFGETGEFEPASFSAGGRGPTFQPLRMTGVWQGVDFSAAVTQATIDGLSATDRQQPPIPPIICLYDGSSYVPITGTDNDISITVDPETGCVILGNGPNDAETIKGWLDSGYRIVLTLAIRLPYPVCVSWRASGSPARTLVLRTGAAESTLAPNTVMGMSGDTVQLSTNELFLERCVSRMRAVLGLMKLWYASNEQTLTYTVSGLVSPWADPAAPPPGTMITDATLPQGSFTLNQVVTRREWKFTGEPSVMVTTARVLPSIDSFL